MMVPGRRLFFLAACVVLPATALAGFVPRFAALCGGVLAICFLTAAADAFLARRRMATLDATAPALLRLTRGVPSTLPVALENRASRPLAARLAIALPAALSSEKLAEPVLLPPGKSTLDWPCTGLRRGDHAVRALYLEVPSPLGGWLLREPRPSDCRLRVYPNLRDRSTAALFLRSSSVGMRTHRQVGKGREFEKLREYLPGDSYEDIHWKATARRGFPAVKQYQVEHAQEVYAVLDFSRLSAREDMLESYIGAALHLAIAAERQGDRFGLVTFSDRVRSLVRARSGLAHFRACREAIYNLEAERVSPDFRELFTTIQLHLRRRSLLLFFTSLDDPLLAETFEREVSLVARRHVVLVNVMEAASLRPLFAGEPAADLNGVYARLAGQMLWNKTRRLQIALHNRGVRLARVDAANIRAQVTAAYLEIKRRQLL